MKLTLDFDFSCKDCKPPKRHVGCHATCKDYKEEKARFQEDKEKARANAAKTPIISNSDFNKVVYTGPERHKKQ